MKKISVVVPVYNRKNDLKRCLDSIKASFDEYEIIVVDDASTDGSYEYALQHADKHLRVYRNDANQGVNYTRNRAVEYATGEYIAFLDSDDKFLPHALDVINEQIIADPMNHYLFYIEGKFCSKDRTEPFYTSYHDWLSEKVYGDFTHVVKRELLLKYPFFEQFRAYENLNWIRIIKETSPQKVIPTIIAWADMERTDNLTKTLKLKSNEAIEGKFRYMTTYFQLYGKDLLALDENLYKSKFQHTVLLGIAASRNKETLELIDASPLEEKIRYTLMVRGIPSFVMNALIKAKANV